MNNINLHGQINCNIPDGRSGWPDGKFISRNDLQQIVAQNDTVGLIPHYSTLRALRLNLHETCKLERCTEMVRNFDVIKNFFLALECWRSTKAKQWNKYDSKLNHLWNCVRLKPCPLRKTANSMQKDSAWRIGRTVHYGIWWLCRYSSLPYSNNISRQPQSERSLSLHGRLKTIAGRFCSWTVMDRYVQPSSCFVLNCFHVKFTYRNVSSVKHVTW